MKKIRHKSLSYKLQGLIFEVRKQLQTGWSEEIYHQALVRLLKDKGISVESKPHKSIFHRGVEVHVFECDLLVYDKIILELKVLPFSSFASTHMAQIIHYLKCWEKDLGILVNFGPIRAELERIVWEEKRIEDYENYEAIKDTMTEHDQMFLHQVRQVVLTIADQYGVGYPETMYRKILAIEFQYCGLNCLMDVVIPAMWNGSKLAEYRTDHLLIADDYLVGVRAVIDWPSVYDFARLKTYLNRLGLRFGFLVNFSKHQLQIFGVDTS